MLILRYVPDEGLCVLEGVRRDGHRRHGFGAWFGVSLRDDDDDGVPEVVEHTYGKNKGDRFSVVYKWDGEMFVESERRR
jgi:hypothetical protein